MSKNKLFISLLCSVSVLSLASPSAFSQDREKELEIEVEALKERLKKLEQALESLLAGGPEVKVAEKKKTSGSPAVITGSDPAPTVQSESGDKKFNIRGRFIMDWSTGSDDNGRFDYTGTKLRAGWVGIQGQATDDIMYRFDVGLGSNAVSVKDAFIGFKQDDWNILVGYSKVPISLEWMEIISQTTVMERGPAFQAFGFGRGFGVAAVTHGENWSFHAGLYNGSNVFNSNSEEPLQAAARFTYGSESNIGKWMLGTAVRYRDMNDSALTYRAKAPSNLAGVMTSLDGVEKDLTVNFDLAYTNGPIFVGGEYAFLNSYDTVISTNGNNTLLHGGYLEIGYVLTGETRSINLTNGTWGRPNVDKPVNKGGMGMWALTARYDVLDLNDKGLYGGKQQNYTLGLSWYMTRFVRAMMEYGHTEVSDQTFFKLNNSADTIGLRFNIDW